MKKLFLLALTISFVSCKYETRSGQDQNVNSDEIAIPLTTGAVITKAGNRDNTTGFNLNENIGVTAYYSKKLTAGGSETDEPDFTKAPYFTNISATALAPTESAVGGDKINDFNWTGGVPQFFPQGKFIFLFAYYPYNNPEAETPAPTEGVTFIPAAAVADPFGPDKIQVKLLAETITETDADITQPDVLVARHASSINRDTPTTSEDLKLVFKHLLAQVQFSILKSASVVIAEPALKSIKLIVPGKADFAVDNVATYSNLSTDEADKITYTITKPVTIATDAQTILTAPLMVLPLTETDLATATLEVVVDYDGNEQTFTPSLAGVTGGLQQGKLNTLTLNVNKTEITLKATIEAWGAGADIDLDLE